MKGLARGHRSSFNAATRGHDTYSYGLERLKKQQDEKPGQGSLRPVLGLNTVLHPSVSQVTA